MNNFYNSKTSLINGEQKFSLQFKGSEYTESNTLYLIIKDVFVKSCTDVSFTITIGSSGIKPFLKWRDDAIKHKNSNEYYLNYHQIDATLTQYDGDSTKYYSIKRAYPTSVTQIEYSKYWDVEFTAGKIEKLYNEFPIDEYTFSHNKKESNNILYSIKKKESDDDYLNTSLVKEAPHLDWDEYFMNIAILASLRSKDPTKVGSVITLNNKLVGMGYNGFPSGMNEAKLPLSRTGSLEDTKYAYVVHSEANAILNSTVYDLTGAKLYCTLFPCNECVKLLLQKGVKEIVYLSDKHHDDPAYVASRKLLGLSDVKVRQYTGKLLVNNI